jgi:serine/threonine protein kinase
MRVTGHIILWGMGYHHRDVSPPNIMYHRNGDHVIGVLNDWDLATVLSTFAPPNTDRTGTIPFMALQLLMDKKVIHLFRHDAESFIWLFLWVCGCSDGTDKEVLVKPYKTWRDLDMLACKKERGDFLSDVDLDDINVSEHHMPNALFCLFLAILLQQLRQHIWKDIPASADCKSQDEKDTALFKVLLPKFREIRVELNKKFSPKDWKDREYRQEIRKYIATEVHHIVFG